MFAPSGIKTPQRAAPAAPGKPALAAEPHADDAVAFSREHALQRDCEVGGGGDVCLCEMPAVLCGYVIW